MSVTSASYTTNSINITVSNETTPVNIMSSVNTAITSLGWSQYDYIAAGSATSIQPYPSASIASGTISVTGAISSFTITGTAGYNTISSYQNPSTTTSPTGGTGANFYFYKGVVGNYSWTPTSGTAYCVTNSGGSGYAVGDVLTFSWVENSYTSTATITVTGINSVINRLSGLSSTTDIVLGSPITATNGTGTLVNGGGTAIPYSKGATWLMYQIVNGTAPTPGTVTAITQTNIITNEYNPMYTYVYRSLCADGMVYKYFILRWDPTKQQFFTSAAEGWDLTTKQPLNETYMFIGTFGQGYDLKDCQILVSGTNRHLMLWPWINGSMGLWTAVCEFERVAAEDTAAAANPCFAWTNSIILGKSNLSGHWPFVFPRLPYGTNTYDSMRPVTNRGMTQALGDAWNYTYGWGSSKSIISSISVDSPNYIMPFGRAYNMSITKSFGAGLDTTTIPLASGGWADTTGTNSTCLILPLCGGDESSSGSSTTYTGGGGGRPTNNGYSAASGVVDMVLIGTTAWLACGTGGIKTYDVTQNTTNGTVVARVSGNFDKLIFDGFRTIYAIYVNSGSGNAAVTRIDTETYAYSTITLVGASCHNMAIDAKYLYVASDDYTSSKRIALITRWNADTSSGFAVDKTFTPTSSNTGFIHYLFPDYSGNLYYFWNSAGTTPGWNQYSSNQYYGKMNTALNVRTTGSDTNSSGNYGSGQSWNMGYNCMGGASAWGAVYYDVFGKMLHYYGLYCNPNSYTPTYATYQGGVGYYPRISRFQGMIDAKSLTNTSSTQEFAFGNYSGAVWYPGSAASVTGNLYGSSTTTYNLYSPQIAKPFRGNLITSVQVRTNPSITTNIPGSTTVSLYCGSGLNFQRTIIEPAIGGVYSTSGTIAFGTNDLYTQGTTALRNINGNIYYVKNLYNMNYTDGSTSGRIIMKG